MNKIVSYIEIDVPFCSLEYGVSPCTAELGVTGSAKCYNCTQTCQDVGNIDLEDQTIRFSVPADYLPIEIDSIPSIEDINFTPQVVSLGVDLGTRPELEVTFRDHPWPDTSGPYDKYVTERSYDAYEQGTFFGKLRARQPFLRGQSMRWIQGVAGQTLAQMKTRHFIIDFIDGPSPDGAFRIVASDFLKFASGERAQAPRISNGFLGAALSDSATSISMFPPGIGNEEYDASGYVNIGGGEIVYYTRSGDTLTVTRGQLGTTARTHNSGDRLQKVIRFASQEPGQIINDLLTDYADVPQANIPVTEWNDETSTFLGRLYTGNIAEPTDVDQLVSEIISQSGLVVWTDDENETIELRVLKTISTDADTFTDETNILEDSFDFSVRTQDRVSRVYVFFGQRSPLRPLTDEDNYTSSTEREDATAETQYGSANIKKIFSRWIPSVGGRAVAQRVADIQIARFLDPPRRCNFDLFSDDPSQDLPVDLAGGYQLQAQPFQDFDGSRVNIPVQITRVLPAPGIISVEAEEFRFDSDADLIPGQLIIDLPTLDLNLRTLYDTFFSTPDNETVVNLFIEAGGVIGSTSTSTPGLEIGAWPGGAVINMTVRGIILGKGGTGGKGGGQNNNIFFSGTSGSAGGPAFNATRAVNIIWDGGYIAGGGGGGGGAGASGSGTGVTGSGGGGGGGLNGGTGGTGSANGQTGETFSGGLGGQSGLAGGRGGAPGFSGATGSSGDTSGGGGGGSGIGINTFSNVTTISGTPDIRGGTSG